MRALPFLVDLQRDMAHLALVADTCPPVPMTPDLLKHTGTLGGKFAHARRRHEWHVGILHQQTIIYVFESPSTTSALPEGGLRALSPTPLGVVSAQ